MTSRSEQSPKFQKSPKYPLRVDTDFVNTNITPALRDLQPQMQSACTQYIINLIVASKQISELFKDTTANPISRASELKCQRDYLFQATAKLIIKSEDYYLKKTKPHKLPFSEEIFTTKNDLLVPLPNLKKVAERKDLRDNISTRMQTCIDKESLEVGKLTYAFIYQLAIIAMDLAEFQQEKTISGYLKHITFDNPLDAKNRNHQVNLVNYLKLTTDVLIGNFLPGLNTPKQKK